MFRVRWPIVVLICLSGGLILVCAFLVLGTSGQSQTIVLGRNWPADQQVSVSDADHHSWSMLLGRYVDEQGNVDYAGWQKSTEGLQALDAYLNHLSQADLDTQASRPARMAFWINAYNAVTMRGILREYPTTSIQNHVSRFGGYNIWRDLLLLVDGKPYSLGQMEHDILRPMQEPRIHFAIVCASRGCPRLLDEAYTPARLEDQLTLGARSFFADPTKFRYESETNTIYVSPILNWYASDFGSNQREQFKTIAPFLPSDEARRITAQPRVRFLDYDWSLNDQPVAPPLPPSFE